ncbi:MAG: dTDP-4-dehydrorhamnose reductase [Betaproteobacteria bacterium]|nr:dTDP-4-dehydrorhamnose reductase [Betaproteobacteria bacterium]
MRILLTGAGGQVGRELRRCLAPLGELAAFDRAGLDLADAQRIRAVVSEMRPEVIVNAGAYTAVDQAESDAPAAQAINATAPGILAEEARRLGARLIHYSTDYVFDGAAPHPYRESNAPAPLGEYGRSKLAGEEAIRAVGADALILRTSWVYGAHGRNFLRTILRLARERDELRIVADQFGAPTWSRMIAQATALLLVHPGRPTGMFHLTAAGETSWHGFATAIVDEARMLGLEPSFKVRSIVPITTAEYPLPARRPANSRLNCDRLARQTGLRLPDWRTSLRLCMEDMAGG